VEISQKVLGGYFFWSPGRNITTANASSVSLFTCHTDEHFSYRDHA